MSRRTSLGKTRQRTDAQLLKDLEDLRRRVKETADSVRDGQHNVRTNSLLGRQFPLPGLDDARRILLDRMRDGACIVSAEGNVIVCNRAFATLLGRPVDRVIGSPLERYLRADDRPILKALLAAQHRAGRGELTVVRPNRTERRVALAVQRTLLYGFKACCLVTRDLTEERTMHAIVQSDELARVVFEQANEAIAVCDPDGKILRANRRAAELAAEPPELKTLSEAFPVLEPNGEEPTGKRVDLLKWLRARPAAPLEAVLPWRENAAVSLLLQAGAVHNAAGEFLGWVITFTDITSRVAAERQTRLAKDLERRLNDSLKKYADELLEKNRDLEQFALSAAHDLQEPLRKINSFGDLLKDSFPNLDDRSRDYLDRIKKSASRMSLMIEDLLQYARASSKEAPFADVDMAQVARDVVSQLELQIEKAGVRVDLGPLPTVRAIRGLMPPLLLNLVNNAIKYRGQEKPWIRIEAERREGAWEFCVCDNGIGIDPRDAERIFKIFERLHSRSQYLGTGIGLAICKKIVERHGGRIWVESEAGKGSAFRFTIADRAKEPAG